MNPHENHVARMLASKFNAFRLDHLGIPPPNDWAYSPTKRLSIFPHLFLVEGMCRRTRQDSLISGKALPLYGGS